MTDLSKLSDEDLIALHSGDISKVSNEGLLLLKGQIQPTQQEPSLGEEIIRGLPVYQQPIARAGQYAFENIVEPIGTAVKSVTTAPLFSGISAIQRGENPILAAYKQFGASPEKAPSGQQILEQAGVTQRPIGEFVPPISGTFADIPVSQALGVPLEIGADIAFPLGVAIKGIGTVAKGVSKAGLTTGKLAAKGGIGALELVTGSKLPSKAAAYAEEIAGKTTGMAKGLSPVVSKDYEKYAKIAKENNIPEELLPSSVKYEPGFVTRAESAIAKGPAGQELAIKQNASIDAVQKAVDNRLNKISGTDRILEKQEAGENLRKFYDEGVQQVFGNADITYKKVQQYAPGLFVNREELPKIVSKLNGIENTAKGLVARGITNTEKEQGRQLLRAVAAFRNTNGSFKQTTEALQQIGRAAFGSASSLADIPVDKKRLQDLYFTVSDALINTVKKDINPVFAKELADNNKVISQFLSDKSLVASDIGNKAVGNDILLNRIFSNSKKAQALESIIGPKSFNVLKSSYLDDLLRKGKDEINFSQASNILSKKKSSLKEILNKKEFEDIKGLTELGQKIGPPILPHVPETGVTGLFKEVPEQILRGVTTEKFLDYLKRPSKIPIKSGLPISAGRSPLIKRLKASMVLEDIGKDRSKENRLKALEE